MFLPRLSSASTWPDLLLYPVRCSVRSLPLFLSLLPARRAHEDSAPPEVDELAEPQRTGEEREEFTRGQRGEAEAGWSQCHMEQVPQTPSGFIINVLIADKWNRFFVCARLLQHSQCRDRSLPEKRSGRQRTLRPQRRCPVSINSNKNTPRAPPS